MLIELGILANAHRAQTWTLIAARTCARTAVRTRQPSGGTWGGSGQSLGWHVVALST